MRNYLLKFQIDDHHKAYDSWFDTTLDKLLQTLEKEGSIIREINENIYRIKNFPYDRIDGKTNGIITKVDRYDCPYLLPDLVISNGTAFLWYDHISNGNYYNQDKNINVDF